MKRKRRAHSPTTKRAARLDPKLAELEGRFALLLVLLRHNYDKVMRLKTR